VRREHGVARQRVAAAEQNKLIATIARPDAVDQLSTSAAWRVPRTLIDAHHGDDADAIAFAANGDRSTNSAR